MIPTRECQELRLLIWTVKRQPRRACGVLMGAASFCPWEGTGDGSAQDCWQTAEAQENGCGSESTCRRESPKESSGMNKGDGA